MERGAEILPRRQAGSWVVGGEEEREHVDQAADASRPHEQPRYQRETNGQFAVGDEERDGGPVRKDEPAQHRDHERIRPIRQEASDPPLKAAAERELGAEDLVLTENEKEHANTDTKVGEGPGIRVTWSAGDLHDTLLNCRERPNGSRLTCGAKPGGRKRPVLRYRQAGAQTSGSSESRPRHLQALVRLPPNRSGWASSVRGAHLPPTTHGRSDSGACHHNDRTSCNTF